MKFKRLWLALFLTGQLTLGLAQGTPLADEAVESTMDEVPVTVPAMPSASSHDPLPIDDVRLFIEILEQLKENYVDPISDKDLMTNAIKGMLSGLDPHSTFYTQDEYESAKESTSGEFAGLGIEVTADRGFIKVISPIDGSPAEKAGLKPGDNIIQIDDIAVQTIDTDKAIKMLRGDVGTTVTIKVLRDQSNTPLTFEIIRDVIKTKSVQYETLNDSIAYVRLSQFQEGSTKEVESAIKEMQTHAIAKKGAIKGMILDLRNNPGGLLDEAVSLSDLFIQNGLIVYTKGRAEHAQESFSATKGDLLAGAPIIVLINSGSASASEIVAGALQDQKRALVVGEKSFGKGSVQTVIDLADGQGLKYTSARYYTPNGTSIQTTGIIPDVMVAPVNVELQTQLLSIREQDIKGHLENENGNAPAEIHYIDNSKHAETDYYLYEALNILQALMVTKENQLI